MGKDRIDKNVNLNLLLENSVYLNLNYKIVLMKYKLEEIKVRKDFANIAEKIAEELAERMYYKLLFLKFLPELKAIESGKIKAKTGKEIDRFFAKLIK